MNALITPEMMDHVIKGGQNLATVAAGSASELTSEAINLFIIDSALSIAKFAVVFVIFYIVKRYCDMLVADAPKENQKLFKAFKTTALILSLIYFSSMSFPHLQVITKALVAPKIFLMERAKDMVLNVAAH